ncbi:MAG TPA: class I SAM-dependent methyltransferase [Cyclobacteriaceae bacterium]
MSQFFDYSKYYNLLYKDKDYAGEVKYISSLIRRFHKSPKSLLDIGCGTGIHASMLSNTGLNVHGVDLSNEMLEIAKLKTTPSLSFSQGDVRNFRLGKKFDVITSLFHVFSYQTSNEAITSSMGTVVEHLDKEGVFIFDCWYGPAVLLDRPVVRVKRMEDENIRVLRVSEPVMDFARSTVEVNFEVNVTNKSTEQTQVIREKHLMRYFFDNELRLFATNAGLQVLNIYGWLDMSAPKDTSWYITVVCSRK